MLHSRCPDVDTYDPHGGNYDVTRHSTGVKRRSARPDYLKRIGEAALTGAALALAVVLVFGGLRELGLWFSFPASNCHGLCDWTTSHGPICPLIAIAFGGALAASSLKLLLGRSSPDEEDEDDPR